MAKKRIEGGRRRESGTAPSRTHTAAGFHQVREVNTHSDFNVPGFTSQAADKRAQWGKCNTWGFNWSTYVWTHMKTRLTHCPRTFLSGFKHTVATVLPWLFPDLTCRVQGRESELIVQIQNKAHLTFAQSLLCICVDFSFTPRKLVPMCLHVSISFAFVETRVWQRSADAVEALKHRLGTLQPLCNDAQQQCNKTALVLNQSGSIVILSNTLLFLIW